MMANLLPEAERHDPAAVRTESAERRSEGHGREELARLKGSCDRLRELIDDAFPLTES